MVATWPPIVLPVSFYFLVDDAGSPNPAVSTRRSLAGGFRQAIYEPLEQIWAQAGIQLEVGVIEVMEVPYDVLQGFCQATRDVDLSPYMTEVNNLPRADAAKINGFYVRDMPHNGISDPPSRTFFVKDEPKLADPIVVGKTHEGRGWGFRVSGHEIGHILDLRHYREPVNYDRTRVMFESTTGVTLSSGEIAHARATAEAIVAAP